MYVIPLVVLACLAVIAVAWSPLFALLIAVPLFVLFLAFVGMRPRADERIESPTGSANKYEDETPTGAWGEKRA
jgi:ABC-type transport system involved in cytochrome bd biosynthesis fused ATPase/permease subunit